MADKQLIYSETVYDDSDYRLWVYNDGEIDLERQEYDELLGVNHIILGSVREQIIKDKRFHLLPMYFGDKLALEMITEAAEDSDTSSAIDTIKAIRKDAWLKY